MGIPELSTGSLQRILQGEEPEKPVFQILGVKKIAGGDNTRLRLLISDGRHCNSYAMLATQLNSMHDEGKLSEFTIVRCDKYIVSLVNKSEQGRRVLVILEMAVLAPGAEVGRRIGDPESLSEVSGAVTSSSATERAPLKATNNNKPMESSSIANNSKNMMNASLNNSSLSRSTHPISSLSPYQNSWVICARVTSKSAMRTWSNAKGEGKLFSMDLVDESGEIRATAFKEQADKFYNEIEPGQVYYITKCQLKPANKQFSTLNNDYEMTFTSETLVQKCEEADSTVPDIKYDFIPIAQIANMENKAAVDTMGICKSVGDVVTFTSRNTNRELKKRDLVLIDQSNASVNLTLWGNEAEEFPGDSQSNPVIVIKGARINEFNGGKSLSMGGGSLMKINPEMVQCHELKGWFENGGGSEITNLISAATGTSNFKAEWLTFLEAQRKNLGNGDKPDYFQCKATIHVTKAQNAFYKACAQPNCNKKVIDQGNQRYRCESCKAEFDTFKYRLLMQMSIGDWTSNRWVTCFNEVAEQILGRSATEVGEALEQDGAVAPETIFSKANFETYIFKLRTKAEVFGDTTRNKIIVQSVAPVNYHEYNKYLIDDLKELTGIGRN